MTGSLQIKRNKWFAVLNFKDSEGKRKQKWVSLNLEVHKNKRQAEKLLNQILVENEDADYIEPNKELFCDFINEWLEMDRPNIQITTYDNYVCMIKKHIYPYFRKKKILLSDIQPIDIQRYYSFKLAEGLSPNTVIKHHAVIRTTLKYAVKMRLIKENAADFVNKPKRERYHASFYNVSELNALFEAAKGCPIETPIIFAAYYGLRRSEILGLKWDSIDFDNKIISVCNKVVRGKTENGKLVSMTLDKMKSETSRRQLPLCDTIYQYLLELKRKQAENAELFGNCYNHKYDNYICVNPNGNLIQPDYVSDRFQKLLEKNGLRHIRFHDLRHSCATLLVSLGFSMKDVQEWLGHADYTLTANTYCHVDMTEKVRMANKVGDKLSFTI